MENVTQERSNNVFYGIECEGDFVVERDELNDREVVRLDGGNTFSIPFKRPPHNQVLLNVVFKSEDTGCMHVVWGDGIYPLVPGKTERSGWTHGVAILPNLKPSATTLKNTGEKPVWISDVRMEDWSMNQAPHKVTNLSILIVYKEDVFLENLLQLVHGFNQANEDYGQIFVSQTPMTIA